MQPLDWLVLVAFLTFSVAFGFYKGRRSRTVETYLLAGKSMPWYAVALSIMATQASAITFISTPGQAYADGMRFLQFYFGLPAAMVMLCAVVVPWLHRLKVYTAYEFLEKRFDLKTRLLTSLIFLVQRGLACSISLYAPALILSVVLGWDIRHTIWIMGAIGISYTVFGGVLAVNWNGFQQFLIVMAGMVVALFMIVHRLPADISFPDALAVAGVHGKLRIVDFSLNWNERYNLWSGLIGGLFLALAYFGTDQSQVQRYLSGQSVTHSRLGLLFNGMAKVPMQFFILFVGAMVFVFYQFIPPPLFFNQQEVRLIKSSPLAGEYRQLEQNYLSVHIQKQQQLKQWLQATSTADYSANDKKESVMRSEDQLKQIRKEAVQLIRNNRPEANPSDVNYVFLTFVTHYLPAGLVGLVIVVVFGATLSSLSSELSSLATCSVVDFYQRLINRQASQRQYLWVSRAFMALWGLFAVILSEQASRLGTLVEAVNILGSLFYGTVLGVFALAYFFRRVDGGAAFWAAFLGEGVVLWFFFYSKISFLWYNVIGTVSVVVFGLLLSAVPGRRPLNSHTAR
jgi:solute:Na+ symporter, SSS family